MTTIDLKHFMEIYVLRTETPRKINIKFGVSRTFHMLKAAISRFDLYGRGIRSYKQFSVTSLRVRIQALILSVINFKQKRIVDICFKLYEGYRNLTPEILLAKYLSISLRLQWTDLRYLSTYRYIENITENVESP